MMKQIKRWRISTKRAILFLLALALLPLLLAVTPVWSSNNPTPKQVIITAGQTINDDLYLAEESITIDGTVKGDAVLAGKRVTVNGTVLGDLIAAAQVVTINGTVGDDVRIAGQALILGNKARVGDDAQAAGLSLENKAGSTIGGNLNFIGAQALLAGNVKQNVLGAMNSFALSGTVGQNLRVAAVGDSDPLEVPFATKPPVEIPKVQPGFTLADTARIGGKVTYQSVNEARIAPKAQIAGGVVREPLESERVATSTPQRSTNYLLYQLQRFGALVLIGWLLLRFVPGWTRTLAATVQARPLPSLGWGVVTFITVLGAAIAIALVTMLLMMVLAFTLPNLILPAIGIGMLANFALLIGFGIFTSFVPQIVLSFLGGRWLLQKLRPNTTYRSFVALVVGLVAFVILTAIPVLGGILDLIVVLLGSGAIWMWGRTKINPAPEDRQLMAV